MRPPGRSASGPPGMQAPAVPRRLAIVVSHPTQYYSPWFRWLAAHTTNVIRVFYLWEFGVTAQHDPRFEQSFAWDVDLLSGYESEFVPNHAARPGTESWRGLDNPALPRRLAGFQPDAILLFGYKYITHLRTIAWARWHRVPLIFRGDSHLLGRPGPGGLRALALRWLYRQFAAITYVGAANQDYFRRSGVPARKLFFAPHAVDHTFFNPELPAARAGAAALRSQLGLSDSTRVILFSGKFVDWKQPLELLRAFLSRPPADCALVLAGSGPLAETLRRAAETAPAGAVHFLPFANQSEMPARYALADLFVLPSRGYYETWGLAVNEAMHMGVPCLVSDRVGCQQDLVIEGKTGWVFRHDEPAELVQALHRAINALTCDSDLWRRRAREQAAGYTYAAAARGLCQALDTAWKAT